MSTWKYIQVSETPITFIEMSIGLSANILNSKKREIESEELLENEEGSSN